MLDETTRKCSEKDITILLGDMYAKIGNENTGYEQVMGKHGLGTMNENGKLFANFCANYNLVTGGTIFPHKKCHLSTWVSPDLKTKNQIDHLCTVYPRDSEEACRMYMCMLKREQMLQQTTTLLLQKSNLSERNILTARQQGNVTMYRC